MTSNYRWLITLIALVAGIAIGVGAVTYVPQPSSGLTTSGSESYSYVGGKRLVAAVSPVNMAASPSWAPGKPLPLSPEDAIVRAQQSLKDLGPEFADSSLSEISLSNEQGSGFFYTVTFRPSNTAVYFDSARILVYLNGKVTLPTAPTGSAP